MSTAERMNASGIANFMLTVSVWKIKVAREVRSYLASLGKVAITRFPGCK